jgi:hypothetical protein
MTRLEIVLVACRSALVALSILAIGYGMTATYYIGLKQGAKIQSEKTVCWTDSFKRWHSYDPLKKEYAKGCPRVLEYRQRELDDI